MIKKMSWKEFRATGLVLLLNQFLHIFGWAIVFVIEDDEIKEVYPARVKFRGFDEKSSTESYIKISEYMDKESKSLLEEAKS